MNRAYLGIFISFIVLTSCSVGPSYVQPEIDVPSGWKNHNTSCKGWDCSRIAEDANLDYWWQVFKDDKLDALEDWAIENNRDLYVAYERINAARAQMDIATAGRFFILRFF